MKKFFCLAILLMINSACFSMVWIDLETTGLDPEKNVILEIASIVTDGELRVIEEGPAIVINQSEKDLELMGSWVKGQHEASGLIEKVRTQGISIAQAEDQTLAFLMRHFAKGQACLCGNSVSFDKAFMMRHMPKIIDFLHYRIMDVSTVKELVHRWYPNDPYSEFQKKNKHRAVDDIRESIAELKHYRKYFFVQPKGIELK